MIRKISIVVLILLAGFCFSLGEAMAAEMSLSTTSTTITVTASGRYTAVMTTNDTDDYLRFTDLVQGSSVTHEFAGPSIVEGGTTYRLRWNNYRRTSILETTPSRVRLRVEGCFDTSAGGACLSGGSNSIKVIEDYTFTPDGVVVNNRTNFGNTGITLDADSGHNGYEWLGVYADVTDAAFDDTGNIVYGDGQTEGTTTTDGAEFSSNNKYVYMPGAGSSTYQDVVVGIMWAGWLDANANGLTHEWNFDENETSAGGTTQDLIATQAQAGSSATTRDYQASWFFLMQAETGLDTEAEREAFINDFYNPDLLTFTTGSEWSGGVGGGLRFDGVNDYVNSVDLDFSSGPFTIEAWFRTLNGDTGPLIHKYGSNSNQNYYIYPGTSGDGTMVGFWDGTGWREVSTGAGNDVNDGRWHHIAMAVDSSSVYGYLDGVSMGSPAGHDNSIPTNNTPISIGRVSTLDFFDGDIDEVRIWNSTRTESQLKENMYKRIDPSSANLQLYYRFDEFSGQNIYDETSNNRDATLGASTSVASDDPTWITGHLPSSYNKIEGSYGIGMSSNISEVDLDGGVNISTLLNGSVGVGATSITVDSTTTFPSSGVAWIDGDKFSYTGTTSTTFTGIPATGELAIIGHADNSVISLMSRLNPFYKLLNWRSNSLPTSVALEGATLTDVTDYNLDMKPVSASYFAGDLLWHSTFESAAAVTTTPDVGSAAVANSCVFVVAKYGRGAECNASGENVDVPMSGNLGSTTGTVEFWYKETSAANAYSNFFESSEGLDQFSLERDNSDTSIAMYINTVYVNWSSMTVNVFDGNWHHVRLTYDTVADSHYLYLDGVSQGQKTTAVNAIDIGAYNLVIGDQNGSQSVNGILDEFRIYDTVLGPETLAVGGDTANAAEYLADDTNDKTLSFAAVDASRRGKYIYFGSDSQFQGLNVDLETVGVGTSPVFVWEYWNGTSWSTLTVTDDTTGASVFTTDGNFYWTAPGSWLPYSVNGSPDLYYIRGRLSSGSYSTSPVENTIKTDVLLLQYLGSISSNAQTFQINISLGPVLNQLMRHGRWFLNGAKQAFTF